MSALHAEDSLNYLIDLEDGCSDPDMKENIQTLRFLISILRPFLRYLFEWPLEHQEMEVLAKHMLSVVKDVSRSFEPRPIPRWKQVEDASTRNEKLVSSNLKTLKGLKKHIARIVTLYISCPYVMHSTRYGDEHLKRYFNSLLQNLKDISIIIKSQRIISQWEKLAIVEERLKYLKTFLCLIFVPFKPGNFVAIAEELAVEISYALFLRFVDDEFVAHEHMMDYILPDLLRKFNSLLLQLKEVFGGGSGAIRLADDHVLGFVDFLIAKLVLLSTKSRFTDEVKVQLQTLADELRFIRSCLMDMLLQNPIQELESLNISIATLIVDAGFFVYFCPDKMEDEELTMTNYWSLGLHDSLETVQNVLQQAADLFKKYLPLSLQSNCPSSNCWPWSLSFDVYKTNGYY